MDSDRNGKIDRVLGIYTQLMAGAKLNKQVIATAYGVNEKTIQRDIDDIRDFLEVDGGNSGLTNSVIYDRAERVYRLEQIYQTKLTNGEILSICKIILDSRAFLKNETKNLLEKLISSCVPQENQRIVSDLLSNELFHYVEPRHRVSVIERVWELGQAIRANHIVNIQYQRTKDKAIVTRRLQPVAIMFSEYYFYLTAFIDDKKVQADFNTPNDAYQTIYRIDRIKSLEITDEKYRIPYSSRFEEGEFRKRVQFMYAGRLQKVKFRYTGPDVTTVLDRLPTAEILETQENAYIIQAEVFGTGIDMWIRSQGDYVQLL